MNVLWLATLNYSSPTFNIRINTPHQYLKSHGINSEIVSTYTAESVIERLTQNKYIVINTNVGLTEAIITKYCAEHHIPIIMDCCESVGLLQIIPHALDCANRATMLVCCSTHNAYTHLPIAPVYVIGDAYVLPREPTAKTARERPRAVWMGMHGNLITLEPLYAALAGARIDLLTMSEQGPPHLTNLGPSCVWEHRQLFEFYNLDALADNEIALCPQILPHKSNTKASQAMALGLCVLASPTTAYQEIIKHGITGYICETADDWYNSLRLLRDDPCKRAEIGDAASRSVGMYSVEAIGMRWRDLLAKLIRI